MDSKFQDVLEAKKESISANNKMPILWRQKKRAFKFKVQQPLVVLYNVFPPQKTPRAGYEIQVLYADGQAAATTGVSGAAVKGEAFD